MKQSLTAERNRLLRMTRAELADLILAERAAKAPAPVRPDIASPIEAVEQLAATITDPTVEQRAHLAAAMSLADALMHGPEQAKAGIAKQFAQAFAAVTDGQAEGGLLDELRRRREEREAARAAAELEVGS